jgi:hypothetical protein
MDNIGLFVALMFIAAVAAVPWRRLSRFLERQREERINRWLRLEASSEKRLDIAIVALALGDVGGRPVINEMVARQTLYDASRALPWKRGTAQRIVLSCASKIFVMHRDSGFYTGAIAQRVDELHRRGMNQGC